MRNAFLTLGLAALLAGFLGSCAKDYDGRLESLEGRIQTLENSGAIARVEQQVEAIGVSIGSLETAHAALGERMDAIGEVLTETETLIDALKKADETLEKKDEALSGRIASLEKQAEKLKGLAKDLEDEDKAINKRIDLLTTYVDGEIRKTSDWATATFATMDQYYGISDDLAALNVLVEGISSALIQTQSDIKAVGKRIDELDVPGLDSKIQSVKSGLEDQIASLKTGLEGDIAQAVLKSEQSLKSWVNGLFGDYYTAALTEQKLSNLKSQLQTVIKEGDASNQDAIDALRNQVEGNTAAIDSLDTILSALKNEYGQDMTSLEETLSAHQTSIKGLQGELGALSEQLTNLQSDHSQDISDLSSDISQLGVDLSEAKTQLTSGYTSAISAAIKANGGFVTETIRDSIQAANDRIGLLGSRVGTLETQVSGIMGSLDSISARVGTCEEIIALILSALEGRIQSVAFVPRYADGMATWWYNQTPDGNVYPDDIVMHFDVQPSALAPLIAEHLSSLSVRGTYTLTRADAAPKVFDLPVSSAKVTNGLLEVVLRKDAVDLSVVKGTRNLNLSLLVNDGDRCISSAYFALKPVKTDIVIFEDPAFKAYCVSLLDGSLGLKDGEVDVQEASLLPKIGASGKSFTSLYGAAMFPNLLEVDISSNTKIEKLDLSGCTALSTIRISGCSALREFSYDDSPHPTVYANFSAG